MQPLFAVHNNVSLLSVNIAPSAFLAALTLALVFISLYIPRLPSLPGFLSFGRRRTANRDKDIVLQGGRRYIRNPQNPAVFEIDDGDYHYSSNGSNGSNGIANSGFVDNRQWQNNNVVPVDWRHRQLPPLPPPPFRPLLTERDEVDDDDYEDQSFFRKKKKSSRGEREKPKRDKEREKEKDRAQLRLKQDKQSSRQAGESRSGRSSPFKRKHSSSATATTLSSETAVTSAELIVRRSRREHVDVYDPPSHSSDVSDREDRQRDWDSSGPDYLGQARAGSSAGAYDADGTFWASFGVLGRFTSRFRPGQQPTPDAAQQVQQLQEHHKLQEVQELQGPREMQSHQKQTFGYPSTHSGFLETDNEETESMQDSVSVGGYSPPAWRRLENGDRSSGFWRKSDNILGSPTLSDTKAHHQRQYPMQPPSMPPNAFAERLHKQLQKHKRQAADRLFASRPSSPDFDSDDDDVVDAVLGFDDDDIFDDPATATAGVGGGFLHNDNIGFEAAQYADDIILQRAMRTRLPGSMSPEKERSPEPDLIFPRPMTRVEGMHFRVMQSIQEERAAGHDMATHAGHAGHAEQSPSSKHAENYIRFAVRSEVPRRTELLDAAIGFSRGRLLSITRTWMHVLVSVLVGVLSISAMRGLAQSAAGMHPVPDLVKVAGVARSFEPLIYYSENGVAQVYDLEATGVAVWDLGESVRLSNLTSAPIIVKELDSLSDTLRTLAVELTKFFANIDGDIDAILYVMEWARRELSQLQQIPSSSSSSSSPSSLSASIFSLTVSPFTLVTKPLGMVYDSMYTLLAFAGVLENKDTGMPTAAGALATTLFGMSGPQRTRAVLHRTFHDILEVLEEAVTTELQHSLALFALFQAVDRQFLNIVRAVAREASVQDEQRADLLAGLWTRILGPSAAATAKYERNRELLRDVREKTVRNKGVLVEHNHRLLALKTSLENLRRRLASPLVNYSSSSSSSSSSSTSSSTGGTTIGLTLEDQIRGLEDVNEHLVRVRSEQKSKLMDSLYGIGMLRERVIAGAGRGSGSGNGAARMAIDDSA